MKPFTLKQPALGHATSCEACSTRNGNLRAGEVYDSKSASNQSRLSLAGLHDNLGALHLERRVTRCREFEANAVGTVFADCEYIDKR